MFCKDGPDAEVGKAIVKFINLLSKLVEKITEKVEKEKKID